MNKTIINIFTMLVLALTAVVTANAQTDLNMRKAIYFTGTKTTAIDLAKDIYMVPGTALHLSAELRTTCDHNVCEFNVGIIAARSGAGAISTQIRIQTDDATYSKDVVFGAAETSKQVILPIKLKLGNNKLTVTIDPQKATTETDETNNSFSGIVMVSWKRANPGEKN